MRYTYDTLLCLKDFVMQSIKVACIDPSPDLSGE